MGFTEDPLKAFSNPPKLYTLRALGTYILRDAPKPWQLKGPRPKPTIQQLKEARTLTTHTPQIWGVKSAP